MLKKAGIIVAGSAVALLAASPLAFATPTYSHSPKCSFSAKNDNSVAQESTGFRALLGAAGAATNGAAPVNTQAQAPVASCNNVDNVLNTTTTTTDINKSKNKTVTKTETTDSNNSVFPALPAVPVIPVP